MSNIQLYFSEAQIIKLLCKYRIKAAKEGHKKHLLSDISHSEAVINDIKGRLEKKQLKTLYEMLPPRRVWLKLKRQEREKIIDPQKIQLKALIRTIDIVRFKVKRKEISQPLWCAKLENFIKVVNGRINDPNNDKILKPKILPIEKSKNENGIIYRPIALYQRLEDRVIISLIAKYLTDTFDSVFLDCSFAFRAVTVEDGEKKVTTHHDAIEEILKYIRERPDKDIFVSECDLKNFFDSVNHNVALSQLEKTSNDYHIDVDIIAKEFFIQYLNSYSFNKDVFSKNRDKSFFGQPNIKERKFEWAANELKDQFYQKDSMEKIDIGVPQGGAISCFLANLLLHPVDIEVQDKNDKDLLYLRFCDDMVILHTNKEKCNQALDRYLNAIKEIKLLVHEPQEVEEYSKAFWSSTLKSKLPYKIGPKGSSKSNVPWLSFVGYQIKYDGSVRVRKKSIEKEKAKQVEVCKDVLQALEKINNSNRTDINQISKKSINQQIFALHNRLISMSVGRIKLYKSNHNNNMCWTNGFRLLTHNKSAQAQLKMLDRNRGRRLYKTKKVLADLARPTSNPDDNVPKHYFGHPFSYCGFLKNKSTHRVSPFNQKTLNINDK